MHKCKYNNGFLCVLGHIPLGCIGFNKPPIEGDQLPEETNRVITVSIKTNTSPIITSKTITNSVMCVLCLSHYKYRHVIKGAKGLIIAVTRTGRLYPCLIRY